jgi:hypothetical protein
LEATFRRMWVCLHNLHETLNHFHVSVGFKPPNDEAAVADDMAENSLELIGILHEARRAAVQAHQAVANQPDLDRARRALASCEGRFHRLEKKFPVLLASFDKLTEMVTLGQERPEWIPWVDNTRQGIEDCREPLDAVRVALAACWQELAERAGMTSVSVRNAIVGQKIVARDVRAEEEMAERVT